MKILILVFVFVGFALINFNQLNKNIANRHELTLTALITEVSADSECSLGIGSPLYGTNCYVYDIWPGGANYYWQFDTYNCLMTLCQEGGTSCCFNTRMY